MIVAVLGLGSIGLRHAANLLALGHDVIGFDPSPDARDALVRLRARATATRQEALAGSAAAIIASPSAQHASDLQAAIEAGLHVFIEKPLAHSLEGIDEVLRNAATKDLVVFAALNQRFNPAVTAARELLSAGRIGRPLWARLISSSYLPDWRPQQDYRKGYAADPRTGGVIFDLVHEFDIATYLFGPARAVAAAATRTGRLEIAAEDCADVVLRHDSGLQSNLHLDFATSPAYRQVEVGGDAGLLAVDVRGRSLMVYDESGETTLEQRFDSTAEQEYRAEMTQFLRCVEGLETPACEGDEALAVLRQVIAARELCGLPQA